MRHGIIVQVVDRWQWHSHCTGDDVHVAGGGGRVAYHQRGVGRSRSLEGHGRAAQGGAGDAAGVSGRRQPDAIGDRPQVEATDGDEVGGAAGLD